MLKHKTHSPQARPEHRSASWIAHNATMREKRKLLSGQKPVIGCAYSPKVRPEPALFIPRQPERIPFKKIVSDVLCMIGFITVMGAMLFVGAAVGF